MNKNVKFKNFFLYIFILWYSTEILFNSTIKSIMGISADKISNIVTWIVFALLMFQIVFLQSYTKRELLVIIFITFPVIIATVLSGQRQMMSVWMFIVASKNVDVDRVIRAAYKILLVMIPAVMIMCLLGVIENATLMRGSVRRFALGFSHPNQLGLSVFQLMACYCYVHKDKLDKLNYIYFLLTILFLFRIPNSKTAYIAMVVLLFMLVLYVFINEHKPAYMSTYEKGILLGTFLLNFFSIVFSYIDVNRNFILARINSWMSSRFSVCHKVWLLYGVSFFGQKVYVTEDERKLVGLKNKLWLDNSYTSLLLRYGILMFLIFSIGYWCLIKSMLIKKEYVLAIILFLYAVYGLMETGWHMITHNIFLITFSTMLYSKSLYDSR